jgi:hypothetical protein
VPVLARCHARLLAAARFPRGGLPRLDTSWLRATWPADCGQMLGLATFMQAARITCFQRPSDLVAGLEPAGKAGAVRLLRQAADDPAAGVRGDHRCLRHRGAHLGHAPAGVRARQLTVRTLLAGMCLTQADGRPAHLMGIWQITAAAP